MIDPADIFSKANVAQMCWKTSVPLATRPFGNAYSLRSGKARSRPAGRIPDLEELDDRLQSDHGLVWTLCQPDNPRHERDRDIRGAERSCGQSARHGSFPAHLSRVGFSSSQSKHSNTLGQAFGQ